MRPFLIFGLVALAIAAPAAAQTNSIVAPTIMSPMMVQPTGNGFALSRVGTTPTRPGAGLTGSVAASQSVASKSTTAPDAPPQKPAPSLLFPAYAPYVPPVKFPPFSPLK